MKKTNSNFELTKPLSNNSVLESVLNQNLTRKNFYIQKAEIKVSYGEEIQKLIASIKYVYPDKYLISLKSRSGVEAARIFITGDTVLINDRINRKIYFGKPEQLMNKYGVSAAILPVILGDLIYDKKTIEKQVNCINNSADLDCTINGLKLGYIVDCEQNKIVNTRLESSLRTNYVQIEYDKFINSGSGLTPSAIKVSYDKSVAEIKIINLVTPWDGSVEFIPGNRYDLIEIL
jgi:hypothetical protein